MHMLYLNYNIKTKTHHNNKPQTYEITGLVLTKSVANKVSLLGIPGLFHLLHQIKKLVSWQI